MLHACGRSHQVNESPIGRSSDGAFQFDLIRGMAGDNAWARVTRRTKTAPKILFTQFLDTSGSVPQATGSMRGPEATNTTIDLAKSTSSPVAVVAQLDSSSGGPEVAAVAFRLGSPDLDAVEAVPVESMPVVCQHYSDLCD